MTDADFRILDQSAAARHTLAELIERLDLLWIRYLDHLDSYTRAQKAVQQQFSAGFFSLARANFTSKTGRRYGQDFFHDGAIATLRSRITDVEGSDSKFETIEWSEQREEEKSDEPEEHLDSSPADLGSASTEKAFNSSDIPDDRNDETFTAAQMPNGDTNQNTAKKPSLATEPLRWFGVLVPVELRQTQTHFSKLFGSPIVDAVNAARDMRQVENEIRKLRKEIRRAQKLDNIA